MSRSTWTTSSNPKTVTGGGLVGSAISRTLAEVDRPGVHRRLPAQLVQPGIGVADVPADHVLQLEGVERDRLGIRRRNNLWHLASLPPILGCNDRSRNLTPVSYIANGSLGRREPRAPSDVSVPAGRGLASRHRKERAHDNVQGEQAKEGAEAGISNSRDLRGGEWECT